MKIKVLLSAIASMFLLATNSAWAADPYYCPDLIAQVDAWQAYLESYGPPALLNYAPQPPLGILAYGDTVTNGNNRVPNARHKADVSSIFV